LALVSDFGKIYLYSPIRIPDVAVEDKIDEEEEEREEEG